MKKNLLLLLSISLTGILIAIGVIFFFTGNAKAESTSISLDTANFENNFYDYLAQSLQEIFISSGDIDSEILSQKVEQLTSEGISMIDEYIVQEKKEGRPLNQPDYDRLNQLRFYVYSSIAIDEEKTREALNILPNNANKLSLLYVYIESFAKEESREISQDTFDKYIQEQQAWALSLDEKYPKNIATIKFKADPIGKPLPNHLATYIAIDGRSLDLNSYRGQYVLVDFWATWCLPCIAELPYLQEAYQDYHDKGFEIISISLDNSEEALRDFISDRSITWPQYYDGKAFNGNLIKDYGVTGIPTLYLVDPKGYIISTNMRGEELIQTLKSHLGV